ncbi:glycosyltransferase [Paracoccus mutanolyticus]|uniref:glycosyltransferase n=1 Tax=Paracoccus mutanolyticus TaxID=1499308 RepID=UPI001CB8F104|nr:glycosyltransferase [Paracoccus mutanolyticus]
MSHYSHTGRAISCALKQAQEERAFRFSLPVICSGIGGMAEMVAHGTTGLHVPPGDPRALAEAMRTAASGPTHADGARGGPAARRPVHEGGVLPRCRCCSMRATWPKASASCSR